MAAQRVRTSSTRVLACACPLFAVFAVGGVAYAQEQAPAPVVKYYVVPYSANPDENTLFRIAEQTLGAGARYPEIFQLNQGRPRPDGTAFTNAASIQPGQVLQLPDDARNSANGPLPAGQPPAVQVPPAPQPAQPVTTTTNTTSGSIVASLTTGIGGAVLGLLGGLRLRRAWTKRADKDSSPVITPDPPTEPLVQPAATPPSPARQAPERPSRPRQPDDEFKPSSGILEMPAKRPKHLLDETGPIQDWVPLPGTPGEHSYFFLSTADTQLIAAIHPDSNVNLTITTSPALPRVVLDGNEIPDIRKISGN